eukprot:CAMPEP_0197031540 /NCGR_PEP_ID=MMETSP1384-20130603/10520_1 /TAXON_ID=29189 /ORGANISM="Ammonia sp." /LENGTH=448 /DNA_ID=CAMNT_0042461081 /DNA_START=23 /DNA_END=1369 /DNA_ORIENTATION=-
MPRSFVKRRGKPRLDSQQENAIVPRKFNRNLPQKQRSKIGQIQADHNNNDANSNNNNKAEELTEEQIQKKMWKNMEVSEEKPIEAPLVRSTFATRYPEAREPYVRMMFDKMSKFVKKFGIELEAVYQQCSLVVSTTSRTWDPYAVIKARDMIRLIARYVPFEHAAKVMQDGVFSDIIEIGKTNVARNELRFIRRRARLIGPNGVTLKAIELLTKCYVLVYGKTICVIGEIKGVRQVRHIVMECMKNKHPIYELKRLMVQQELKDNPELSKESWDRFLPKFNRMKRNNEHNKRAANGMSVNQIKKLSQKKKRTQSTKYTPWPPAPTPSKIDVALESGAYWNKEWREENLKKKSAEQKFMKHQEKQQQRQLAKREDEKTKHKTLRRIKKEMRFVAPRETESGVIQKKLKIAGHSNQGKMIKGTNFKRNLMRIGQMQKKNKSDNDVKQFLV